MLMFGSSKDSCPCPLGFPISHKHCQAATANMKKRHMGLQLLFKAKPVFQVEQGPRGVCAVAQLARRGEQLSALKHRELKPETPHRLWISDFCTHSCCGELEYHMWMFGYCRLQVKTCPRGSFSFLLRYQIGEV